MATAETHESFVRSFDKNEAQAASTEVNIGDKERAASIVAGTVLLAAGLLHARVTDLIALAAGTALAYRGLTGHCHVLKALESSTKSGDRQEGSGSETGKASSIQSGEGGQELMGQALTVENEAHPSVE